jgi:nucleotide-binding universal stress UspA family protein
MSTPLSRLWLATDLSEAAARAGERAAQLATRHGSLFGLLNAREHGGWVEALSSPTLPAELTERIDEARLAALQVEAQRLGVGGAAGAATGPAAGDGRARARRLGAPAAWPQAEQA